MKSLNIVKIHIFSSLVVHIYCVSLWLHANRQPNTHPLHELYAQFLEVNKAHKRMILYVERELSTHFWCRVWNKIKIIKKHTHKIMYLRGVSDPATSGKHARAILPSPEHTIQTLFVIEWNKKLTAPGLKPIKLCVPFIYSSNNPALNTFNCQGKTLWPYSQHRSYSLTTNKTYDINFPYSCTCFSLNVASIVTFITDTHKTQSQHIYLDTKNIKPEILYKTNPLTAVTRTSTTTWHQVTSVQRIVLHITQIFKCPVSIKNTKIAADAHL